MPRSGINFFFRLGLAILKKVPTVNTLNSNRSYLMYSPTVKGSTTLCSSMYSNSSPSISKSLTRTDRLVEATVNYTECFSRNRKSSSHQ